MNDVPYSITGFVLFVLLASGARQVCGQDVATIAVRVTAVYKDSVYLDKGWTEQIYHGDKVVIYCGQGRAVRGKVQAISSHEARVITVAGDGIVQVGMHGRVIIPTQDQRSTVDAQPPWSEPPAHQSAVADAAQVDFQVGQENPGAVTRIEVGVTASSGGSIYLDKGRASGLSPGDEVVLFPPSGGIVNATVQSTSRSSSRCTILSGQQNVDIGTRGQALLPTERITPKNVEMPAPPRNSPEHPPWTHPPENWDQNQPLLAPAFSRNPEERKPLVHGRLFADYMHTWNRSDAWNQYSLGRVGASVWLENPFRRGGGLHVDGEFNRRGVFLTDSDDVDGPGRLDRISYYWGGTDDRPLRIEVGRFLSRDFPEFGVVDGTELVYRTAAGHRIGVSAGFLPQPFPNLATRNDMFVTVFSRWVSDPLETLSSAIGFQKTWHKGTPDRDLLIWSADYDPNEYLSLHSTIWGDFYDSHDTLKSTNFEISEAVIQPIIHIDPGHGIGAHVSYVSWPQLLRRDYSPFVEQQITGDRVFRWGLFTWQDLSQRIRLGGRVDQWYDQSQENGTSWEARVAFRELLFQDGEFAVAVFSTEGTYSSGPGGRVSVNRRFRWCFASLAYDIADYRLSDRVGEVSMINTSSDLLQHAFRANLDFTVGMDKSVSVFADYRFGQNQNAIQAGMFFQKRL